jgi:hypothetical protein
MADAKKKQTAAKTAPSLSLEDMAEAVTRGTLRALAERDLANKQVQLDPIVSHLPGGTVLGIVFPCEGNEFEPCCHRIFGLIILPRLDKVSGQTG